MAEMRKRNGKWLVTVRFPNNSPTNRKSQSKTFATKLEAMIWAERIENGDDTNQVSDKTFADVAILYRDRVSTMKKGRDNETVIINHVLKEDWVKINLSQLTTGHLEDYRDMRLKTIKPSTFRRQWLLIRSIARYASQVDIHLNQKMFQELVIPAVYDRPIERITPEMEARLLETARVAGNRAKYLVPLINLALATAMRRGELCSLEWCEVNLKQNSIYIPAVKAKSGKPRWVPITDRSRRALEELRKFQRWNRKLNQLDTHVVPATGNAVRLAFGRIRSLAGLDHIRFHDLRHESISRFHEMGLTIPEIMSISGHQDMETLNRYSHASANSLVAKLGGGI